MDFHERYAMGPVLWSKLISLTGTAFQEFFQDLMSLQHPGFVDVSTSGSLGDLSSDGLNLQGRKLYACYAPEIPGAEKTVGKFNNDLRNALEKRGGSFDTFVFVHNSARGTHPSISVALTNARDAHPDLSFELVDFRHIRDWVGQMERRQVEDLLGVQLPLVHETTVGLHEMVELLNFLAAQRIPADSEMALDAVSEDKLVFSELSQPSQADLRDAMKACPEIDGYYRDRADVTERDEVAARFHREYLEAKATTSDPEQMLLQLRIYLAGSMTPLPAHYRAATAVLAYFFETCDIFDSPPLGWRSSMGGQAL